MSQTAQNRRGFIGSVVSGTGHRLCPLLSRDLAAHRVAGAPWKMPWALPIVSVYTQSGRRDGVSRDDYANLSTPASKMVKYFSWARIWYPCRRILRRTPYQYSRPAEGSTSLSNLFWCYAPTPRGALIRPMLDEIAQYSSGNAHILH